MPKAKRKISPLEDQSRPRIDFNKEDAFMLYATFCGDVERTAHALNIPVVAVLNAVEEDGWSEKLRGIIELKKSNRPGDVERAINRAMNFVQAHKLRLFLERMLGRLCGMTPEEAEKYLMQENINDKGQVKHVLSTRPMADLASALEKCHAMSYMALNDSAAERSKRNSQEESTDTSGGEIHAKLSNLMAGIRNTNSPRAVLLDAQLQIAQEKAAKPPQ
jgi:hypothetical protein